jgi:outer membrane protein OmpA-like peptidoglycan-associated protein
MSSVDPLPAFDDALEIRHSRSLHEPDGAARDAARRALARAALEHEAELRETDDHAKVTGRSRNRWASAAAACAVLVLGAGSVSIAIRGGSHSSGLAGGQGTETAAARRADGDPATSAASGAAATSTAAPGASLPAAAGAPSHGAVYEDGHVTLRGTVPTRAMADALYAKAAAVVGAANVTDEYVIDPSAPSDVDGRVRVADPVLFRTGSAQLDPRYASLLDAGVVLMKLNPNVALQVVGHTDSTGSDETNQVLSVARAQSVVDYVKAKGGFDDARFIVSGVGASQPIADNATPEGRTANRRIEVTILGLLDPTTR